jgi:hypothetical protein
MSIKLINFELLYANGSTDINKLNFKLIIEEMTAAVKNGYREIVGLLLLDGFLYKDNEQFYQTMRDVQDYAKVLGVKKITLLAGMCENFEHKLKKNGIYFDVEFFDFTLWMIYQSYDEFNSNLLWNHKEQNFLFLGGIPSRKNRITLLSKLYDRGMLTEKNKWSFFPPWTTDDKSWCRAELKKYSDVEYETFLNYCNKSIDELYNDAKEYSKLDGTELLKQNIYSKDWLQDPGFIDPNVYSSTAFSIISEGNAYPPASDFYFLTEKTWRAVANNHPFIISGYPEQVEYAKKRGLKTFDEYFVDKNYYNNVDEDARLESIVTNTKAFLENIDNSAEQIRKDISHNYNLFISAIKESKEKISQYSKSDQQEFFYKKGFSHLIRIPDGN